MKIERSIKGNAGIWMALSFIVFQLTGNVAASGIDCSKLPQYSNTNPQVNLHHIFCGEIKKGAAKGYHANPGGETPSTYVARKVSADRGPNPQGLRTWFDIQLAVNGQTAIKSMSSIFPYNCTQDQIVNSVVYSSLHSSKNCAGQSAWVNCGPSAPNTGTKQYCLGDDGSIFTIGTSTPQDNKINTGFPVY